MHPFRSVTTLKGSLLTTQIGALKDILEKNNIDPQNIVQEFRTDQEHDFKIGSVLSVQDFDNVPMVDIVATTKGRGFQGVVKRWNFSGGPASHGSMFHRRGGSYGLCQWPGRVFKNKKMPGHMGDAKRTTQNLKVVKIIPEKKIFCSLREVYRGLKVVYLLFVSPKSLKFQIN